MLVIGGGIGTLMGLVSGYFGGWVDEILMRIVDIKFSLPLILIALALAIIWGASIQLLMGLLAFLIWGSFSRQVRGEALVLKEADYVKLARVAGASTTRILYKHIIPGVMNTVVVVATFQVGSVILAEASLSFLGAGIPPPTPAWGSMASAGRLSPPHYRLVGNADTRTCDCADSDRLHAFRRLDTRPGGSTSAPAVNLAARPHPR